MLFIYSNNISVLSFWTSDYTHIIKTIQPYINICMHYLGGIANVLEVLLSFENSVAIQFFWTVLILRERENVFKGIHTILR